MKGKLLIIGFGPGSFEHITKRAKEAIEESDVVIGYNTYVDLISGLLTGQQIVRTGMTEEVSRAQEAVRQAEAGKKVAVISSGDAGVYGMAGLVYEVLIEKGWTEATGVEVEVIPGISAINSCASLLGAPVMHDACTISLSDHLTPWEIIAKRIEAAGAADFVVALYNPRSGRRTRQIVEAQRILLKYRSPDTPVGIVKSAYRDREQVVITTLEQMLDHDIGMLTTVIIGNSATFLYDEKMITPRGYQRKYTLTADEQALKPHQRLKPEAEPWALPQFEEEAPRAANNRTAAELRPAAADFQTSAGLQAAAADIQTSAEIRPAASDTRSAAAVRTAAAKPSSYELAMEALLLVQGSRGDEVNHTPFASPLFQQQSIFEVAVSPGVANKRFTPAQMMLMAELAGESGEIEYTPHHQIILRVPTTEPKQITAKLQEEGLLLAPIGDVVQLKACDFCNGEKDDSIPYAEELYQRLNGRSAPKELRIGFNGCGMTCYGAVKEDIGIVYRRGKFDLFLGAKTVGRNAHSGQPVAEGIEPEALVETVERIVNRYITDGFPNERFHKYFKRVKQVEGFEHREVPVLVIDNAVCGD
ncbi:precorrin-3B C(17)-methyltransferase [Brevibacillus sp. B_LB10_24]|uniref:precorrin-3B C(17)-methyltransferase n=1 Tax=Brevibacillus sp. B_LB10_24 TaxID=3380645 RepID=UPI0038B8C60F